MEYEIAKAHVNKIIAEYIAETPKRFDPRMVSGLEYILTGGKRLRAVITLAILQKLQPQSWQNFAQVCLAPEFVHTASLIIDDLPAFDNAAERRGRACIHRVKGEGLAYLVSFTLITEAVLLLHKNLQELKTVHGELAAFHQYENQVNKLILNISGSHALEGQLLSTFHTSGDANLKDLASDQRPAKLSATEIKKILHKKTASFFQIALITGWTVGNGDLDQIPKLEKLGELLGLCYQIYDDFADYSEDVNGAQFSHNYIYHCGLETAYSDYQTFSTELQELLVELDLNCAVFDYIQSFMTSEINAQKRFLAAKPFAALPIN